MNPGIAQLQPYPFEKLRGLLDGVRPPADRELIDLAVGEPRHPPPEFVLERLAESLATVTNYPTTTAGPALRESIARWLAERYGLDDTELAPTQHIAPLNGTREGLFSFAQCLLDRAPDSRVLCPNPGYQIYEGAALLGGAQPAYLDTTAETGFLPNFDAVSKKQWENIQLVYICSPGNPTGAVMPEQTLIHLIELADKHEFVIAADECYSEIYQDEGSPPVGLLQVCAQLKRNDFRRCIAFHSLSKRSNLPGLRSGFAAGDSQLIQTFLRYRTYHGCTLPRFIQDASTLAWRDETHVRENREQYRKKFDLARQILEPVVEFDFPAGGFYLWLATPVDDQQFAKTLFQEHHIKVLPGSFLGRPANGSNPGQNRIRVALVGTLTETELALHAIARCFTQTQQPTPD